ncbi:beta strand repeat-containing protein [Pseudomarimonas salicorniae]|uniref:DUF11 domain-containing protein n=1 Tax=Pseudomarimonas salicorniae TaxID=2933270 RepID=A0ABT0GIV5_9GAMM|nr:DUF11 domain-containing protein [Lysobacter sp. CAU 1642]MCK7594475.1 DUF11 domain-containing protein [Lysobacter sp. CAU 1642]
MRNALLGLALVAAVGGAQAGAVGPTFNKAFAPDTIGPGSSSALTFTIDNSGFPQGATSLSFSDSLPAGVTIAATGAVSNGCGGTLVAPAGTSTINFSDGVVGANGVCTIVVDVTSAAVGTHTNVSSVLSFDTGSGVTPGNSATDDLVVAADRPGFSKSFSPSGVAFGGRSTLTFLIDNSLNASTAFSAQFTDSLPLGVRVASPSNVFTDCTGGSAAAAPGGSTISLSDAVLSAGTLCTVSVDVVADAAGMLNNRSGSLTSLDGGLNSVDSGFATAALQSTAGDLTLVKRFLDDPVAPGGQVRLQFEIANRSRTDSATAISFSDDLDAALSGLVVSSSLPLNPCGAGSSLSGASTLTLSSGTLAAEASCTFEVTLAVPTGATPGTYTNTTSSLTATLGGSPGTYSAASDLLFVQEVPVLTITSPAAPVAAGDTFVVTYALQNVSTSNSATDIAFSLAHSDLSPSITITTLPAAGSCGAGSIFSQQNDFPTSGQNSFRVQSAQLAPSASCSFDVTYQAGGDAPPGNFSAMSTEVSATVGGGPVQGGGDQLNVTVLAAPTLTHSFDPSTVRAGDTVDITYTLQLSANSPGDASLVGFTHDLNSVLTGLTAVGLPQTNACGTISGTGNLTFSNGTLAAGDSCQFTVTAQVPSTIASGSTTSTTSVITAEVLGASVTSPASVANLVASNLVYSQDVTNDPVRKGDTVTLEFTFQNRGADAITGIFFTEALNADLTGLASTSGTLNDVCGSGSSITGTTLLIFTGGNLAPGGQCTFSVTLQVPAGAAVNTYPLSTSSVTFTENSTGITLPPMSTTLEVTALTFDKDFTDDPVAPGGSVTLQYTIENPAASGADAMSISFSDNLGAALSGLAATGLPQSNVCGTGSTLSGTGTIVLSGGVLAPGASCTFQVTLSVPTGVGGNFTSTSSALAVGATEEAPPASDVLSVNPVTFSAAVLSPSAPGGTTQLQFTLQDLGGAARSSLAFSINLGASLSGLVAQGPLPSSPCGAGSTLSGTGLLQLNGGSLAASGSCSFTVNLAVPGGAAAGVYPLVTSSLTDAGLQVSASASTSLQVVIAGFSKAFAPSSVVLGGTSTLTFTIDNSAASVGLTGLGFTDALPAGMVVATPANASSGCGGTLTAAAGSGTVSFSGGTVGAGNVCTLQVDVRANATGSLVNTTGALQTAIGSMGSASATLTVSSLPTFSKVFSPSSIAVDQVSTLIFTISNAGSSIALTGLDFIDSMPDGLTVANPPNASTTCTGGSLVALPGSSTISYGNGSLAAGATCTVQADVRAAGGGTYVNTSGDLASNVGNLGNATATLTVSDVPLNFSKTISPTAVLPGGQVTVDYLIQNSSTTVAVSALTFTDDFASLIPGAAAVGLPLANPCGTGSQINGTGLVTLTGGQIAAGGQCSFSITVQLPAGAVPGSYTSTSSAVTGTGGTGTAAGPAASAPINIVALPTFTKQMPPSAQPGTLIPLTFTLSQPANGGNVTGLAFTDDLEAFIPGARAEGLPQSNVCGAGSLLSGSAVVMFQGGSLNAGQSCTFVVSVRLPANLVGTNFTNVTSPLSGSFGAVAVNGGPGSAASSGLSLQSQRTAIIPVGGWPLALIMVGLLGAIGAGRLRR